MKNDLLAPVMVGCVLVSFSLVAWGLINSNDDRIRHGKGLCEELDYELGESVRSELISPEQALEVSQRCYDRFGANSYD